MKLTAKEKAKRAKMMAEIGYLAYAVNAETEYCVFFEYAGHVDLIRIDICASKDDYNSKLASTEHYRSDGSRDAWLQSKITHLKHILETHEIDYGRMKRVVYEVASHQF